MINIDTGDKTKNEIEEELNPVKCYHSSITDCYGCEQRIQIGDEEQ